MGLSGAAAAAAAEQARLAAEKERLKKGKNPDQCKAIDFFYAVGDGSGCGCLGGEKVITMEQYIAMVQKKLGSVNVRQMALNKIGLDESEIQEIPPIVLSSFVFDDDCLVKADGSNAVTSQYSVTWIFFSRTQMYTYKYIFDTTSNNNWELTNDFFYSDITCFSTERENRQKVEVKIKKGCLGGEDVISSMYVNDILKITVPNMTYTVYMRNSPVVEQSIQAAKNMLREKKFSQ